MLEKLRKNYGLSVWIVRLSFYVSFIFRNWFNIESAFTYFGLAGMFEVALPRNFWLIAATGLVSAVLAEIVIKLLLRLVQYLSKIVSIPTSEYATLFLMCLVPVNLILGALNLTFYVVPPIIGWGGTLFELVVATPFLYLFFAKTKALYFNDKSAPYYFKVFSIAYLVYFGASLLTLLWGLI